MAALKIGCDPELFIRDKYTEKFVSAYGIVPGTKDKPYKVDCGTVQVDGFAAEIGTTPVTNVQDWLHCVHTVLGELNKFLYPRYEYVIEPTVEFDRDYFFGLPEEQRVMGCDPDFNAYTGLENPRPASNEPIRSAGGHIHLGFDNDRDPKDPGLVEDCKEVAMQMDWYVGMPLVLVDNDTRRRSIYGKAGSYRVKPYGCEYRTPSNVWLRNEHLMRFVFEAAQQGINDLYKGRAKRLGTVAPEQYINKSFYRPGDRSNIGYQLAAHEDFMIHKFPYFFFNAHTGPEWLTQYVKDYNIVI